MATTVSFGRIVPDDQGGRFVEGGADGIFADFVVRSRYEQDRQRYMAAIASPNGFQGAAVAFFQLAAPTLLWVADWTALKAAAKPEVPDPFSVDANWVLLDVHLELGHIDVLADGATALYRVSGTYVFGHKKPANNPFTDVVFPLPPYLEPGSFTRTMPLAKLKAAILAGQAGGSASPGVPKAITSA